MKSVKVVYKELLELLSFACDEDGKLVVDAGGLQVPMMNGDTQIQPLLEEWLDDIEDGKFDQSVVEDELTYFFPMCEDHSRGKSPIVKAMELALRIKANVKGYALMVALLELCNNVKAHKRIKPQAKDLLLEVGKVDDKSIEALAKVMKECNFMYSGLAIHNNIQYNMKVNGVSYPRVGTLSSDLLVELSDVDGAKVFNASVRRKMDRKALQGLFLYIFNGFKEQEVIHFPIEGNDAPNLSAIVTMSKYLDKRFTELAYMYQDFLDDDVFELLTKNSDLEVMDVTTAVKASRKYRFKDNDGVAQVGAARAKAVARPDVEEKETKVREVSKASPRATTKRATPVSARGDNEMNATKGLLDGLSRNLSSRPKRERSRGGRDTERGSRGLGRGRGRDRYDDEPRGGRGGRGRGGRGSRDDSPLVSLEFGRGDYLDVFADDIRGHGDNVYVLDGREKLYLMDVMDERDFDDLLEDIEAETRGNRRDRGRGRTSGRRDTGRNSRSSRGRDSVRGRGRDTGRGGRGSRSTRSRWDADTMYELEVDGYIETFYGDEVVEGRDGDYVEINRKRVYLD